MENRLYENMNNVAGEVISDDDYIGEDSELNNTETECISDESAKTPYPIMNEDDGRIYCQVCGKTFKSITQSHLKLHNITSDEYKQKYNVPMVPDGLKNHMRLVNTKKYKDLFKDKENKKSETELDDSIEEIPVDDLLSSQELDEMNGISFDQDFKDLKPVNQPINDPMYAKTEIAYNLEELFNGVQCVENYFVEEYTGSHSFTASRHLKYSFVTDIAIPERKVAFFFPDTFWHNREVAPDPNKYTKLKEDGWSVIEVKGNAPNLNQIKEKLRFANLI